MEQDNEKELVFIDESGNLDLPPESENISDYYVITGVFFPQNELKRFSEIANIIVRKHAGTGNLKSSNIANDSKRRENVLHDIAEHQFSFYSLVINKTQIWRDSGLKWHKSFYKYLHKMFFSKIKRVFLGIDIIADNHGSPEFMKSFEQYFNNNSTLFDSFIFAQSSNEPLLQIADVIAGSVRRYYLGQESIDLIKIIGYPSLIIEEWPPPSTYNEIEIVTQEYDKIIRNISLRNARNYVEQNITSDDEESQLRAQSLRYLLSRFNQNPNEYIHRSEVVKYLKEVTNFDVNEQILSSSVFGDARDNDVIVSSTDKGVKLPLCVKDLYDWMSRTESQVAPYLRRVEKARNIFLLASHNQLDIADNSKFPELYRYLIQNSKGV